MIPFGRNLNGWSASAGFVGALVLIPLGFILFRLTLPATDGWQHVAENLLPTYAKNTALLVVLTNCWALVFAVLPAWLVSAYTFPGSRWLNWLLAAPLAIPSYIAAFAWAGVFDFTGPIQQTARSLFGPETARALPDITNIWGVSFVLGSVLFPYVYVSTRTALTLQSGSTIEAARSLGASPKNVFLKVVIPSARPAIIAGLALVTMETLNVYGAVHYYGVDTLTTGIFRAFYGLGDKDAAIRLAGVLLVVALGLFAFERYLRGKRRFDRSASNRPLSKIPLHGRRATVAALTCGAPVVVGFVVPCGMLVWWSSLTLHKIELASFAALSARSFTLAAAGALVVVATGLLLAYVLRLIDSRIVRGWVGVAGSGYAVPGAIIAVGITSVAASVDRFAFAQGWIEGRALFLGGTVTALIWAYGVRFLAVSLHPIDAAFERLGNAIGEAARSLGASPLRVLGAVHFPLLRPAIIGAATLAFVDILKELPLTLILRPFDFDTLATHTYQLASEESVPESAPGALILVLFGLLALWIANRTLDD